MWFFAGRHAQNIFFRTVYYSWVNILYDTKLESTHQETQITQKQQLTIPLKSPTRRNKQRQNHQDEVICTSTPCSCCCCSVHHGNQGRSIWRGKCPSPSQRNGRRRLHVLFWKSKKMLLYVINEWVSFLNVSFMMEDRSLNYASLIAWFDIWCHE
jgi:hypothetical protein